MQYKNSTKTKIQVGCGKYGKITTNAKVCLFIYFKPITSIC